jgi:tellurite resistance protein TerC
VPLELQKRVLIFGVIGAIVLRTIMIFAGAWLIASSTGCSTSSAPSCWSPASRCAWFADDKPDLDKNPLIRWMRNHMKITTEFDGERFFDHDPRTACATPRRCSWC